PAPHGPLPPFPTRRSSDLWPRRSSAVTLDLPEGATVAEAIVVCGLPLDGITGQAVFGERVAATQVLRHGDRVELLAPLLADPKEDRKSTRLNSSHVKISYA